MQPDDADDPRLASARRVEALLSRVDQELSARERFGRRPPPDPGNVIEPWLPDASGLASIADLLRSSPAPMYATNYERLSQRLPRQVVNAMLRGVVGHQRHFNVGVADATSIFATQVDALRTRSEAVYDVLHNIDRRLQDHADRLLLVEAEQVEAAMATQVVEPPAISPEVQDELDQLRRGVDGLHRWNEELVQTLDHLSNEQGGASEWIKLVERKVFGLALAVRSVTDGGRAHEFAAPEIVDPDRLQDRIEKAGGQTLLNIGAGEKTFDDHINVDGRALPEIDVVADVRRLPFEPETVDGITCAHLVEHFREHELRTVILPYWRALLRPGGRLTIVCPNLQACVDMLNDGRLTIDEFGLLVYGGQEYEGDDHFAGYTPRTLEAVLRDVGFVDVEVTTEARLNGICPELEVVAIR